MITAHEHILFTIKCFISILAVNFIDDVVLFLDTLGQTGILVYAKDFINLVVSLLIGIYWVVKILKKNKK